jgi:alpha-tubulin suppressor-like RCC1 family protein
MLLGVTEEGFEDGNHKKNKKTIYYRPVELKINRNLIRITGGVSDLYEAYFGHSAKISLGVNISQKGKIKKISCGGSHTLAITSQGEVLAWGYGESGQLGLGVIQSQETPCIVFFGKDRKIRKVYAGYSHSMAITASHEVYVWGDGKKGQTCQINSNEGNYVDQPRAIDELSGREVIQGACGFDNCAVITSDYKLYVWGGNASNKLGLLNSHNEFESTPRLVESLNAVKKVSLGYGHSAVINTNGELYTWGHGFFGQLGHGDTLTKKEPLKVDHLDLKYQKVKCGQYHTLAIDKKKQVYIWGRGGINLNADSSKHKLLPEIVEDFRASEIIGIEAGMGNSLVLTRENQVFAWGDNSDGKAGGQNKIVAGKAQQIQFEKQKVVKIIAGYSHCFAITESGDIFGWGNNKCFRLTSEVQALKVGSQILPPKLLSNLVTNISKTEMVQDDRKEKKKDVDERYIQTKLIENKPVSSYKELEHLILNDDESKFGDEELKRRDLQLQYAIEEGFKKIENNNGSITTVHYIEYNQLFTLRLNEIKVKEPHIGREKYNPPEIFNNISEIEKIFTLFYLHPCYLKDYFEDDKIKTSNFSEFLTGLRPMFTDLHRFSRKSESLDNIVYLTICKLVIEFDARNYNYEIDSLFLKNKSYAEQLIELYFFNEYGRSILFDIFDKTFNEVYSTCLRHSKRSKDLGGDASKNLVDALNDLMELFKNSSENLEGTKKENIDEAINLMRTFLNDLENNISIVPVYVFYYLTEIKKKLFEMLVTAKDSQGQANERDRIEKAIMRLFYKNVIARLLKELSTDERYMKSHLGIGGDLYAKKLFSLYLTIIADFLVKVADNTRLVLEEHDEALFSQIDNLNKTIQEMHIQLDNIYRTTVINSKYDIKKEILTSIIYSHTTPIIKKMRINLGSLINFLRVIFKCLDARQITGNPLFKDYEVFKIFDPSQQTLKSSISYDSTFKLCIYIDVRFLLDHKSYPTRFKVETGASNEKSDEETKLNRCTMCHLIMPSNFINRVDKKELVYFENFKEKIKSNYLTHICNVVRDNAFPRDLPILSLKDFAKAVKDVQDKKQKESNESAREVRNALEEMLNKSNAEEVGFKNLINEIYAVSFLMNIICKLAFETSARAFRLHFKNI